MSFDLFVLDYDWLCFILWHPWCGATVRIMFLVLWHDCKAFQRARRVLDPDTPTLVHPAWPTVTPTALYSDCKITFEYIARFSQILWRDTVKLSCLLEAGADNSHYALGRCKFLQMLLSFQMCFHLFRCWFQSPTASMSTCTRDTQWYAGWAIGTPVC